MEKVKINIGIIGNIPFEFNCQKIKNWTSDIFEICDVSEYVINAKQSDTSDWGYSDDLLNKELPSRQNADIFIGVTYVPIEGYFYARILKYNRVIISLFDIHKDIKFNNIPIENLVLRILYASSLIYLIGENIPTAQSGRHELLHDDTMGCIYDMTGNQPDVIYSLDKPQLCEKCKSTLRAKKIPNEIIEKVNKELKNIKKDRYHRIEHFIKKRPLLSIFITFIVGIMMSVIANYIYDYMTIKDNAKAKSEIIENRKSC